MSDRLLYQSEAEQLVLEGDTVVADPDVTVFHFLGTSGIQGSLDLDFAEKNFCRSRNNFVSASQMESIFLII